jgi:hypothetical protein
MAPWLLPDSLRGRPGWQLRALLSHHTKSSLNWFNCILQWRCNSRETRIREAFVKIGQESAAQVLYIFRRLVSAENPLGTFEMST